MSDVKVRCGRCGARLATVAERSDGLLTWTGDIGSQQPPDGAPLSPRIRRATLARGRAPRPGWSDDFDWVPFLVPPVHLITGDCAHTNRITTTAVLRAMREHGRKVVGAPARRDELDHGPEFAGVGVQVAGIFIVDPMHPSRSAVRVGDDGRSWR